MCHQLILTDVQIQRALLLFKRNGFLASPETTFVMISATCLVFPHARYDKKSQLRKKIPDIHSKECVLFMLPDDFYSSSWTKPNTVL